MRILLALSLLVSVIACGPVPQDAAEPSSGFEQERVHADAQVKIWIPAGWELDDADADALVMSAPAGDLGLLFRVVEGEDLASALLAVTADLLIEVDDIELVGDPEELDINSMPALVADARGSIDGAAVELSVAVVETPAGKYLLIVGAADSATLARHEATVLEVFRRLQPYAGPAV